MLRGTRRLGDKKKGEKVRDSIGWLLNCLMEYFLLSVSPKIMKARVCISEQ